MAKPKTVKIEDVVEEVKPQVEHEVMDVSNLLRITPTTYIALGEILDTLGFKPTDNTNTPVSKGDIILTLAQLVIEIAIETKDREMSEFLLKELIQKHSSKVGKLIINGLKIYLSRKV